MIMCSYCRESLEGTTNIVVLDKAGDYQRPMLHVHHACAFAVRKELDRMIDKFGPQLGGGETMN